ncbi:hypothetical protein [Chryseobacterium sp. M5A1_1a]
MKKDDEVGMEVTEGSRFHDHYFYQKKHVGKKVFKVDFYNEKAGIITVK